MFLFLSFMFFSSKKSENRKVEQVLLRGEWGLAPVGGGGGGERGRRMNMAQIMCIHVHMQK
jgi:hypothetical protein